MKTSFMYHVLGIREQECVSTRYEGGRIILKIKTKENKLYCAKCGSLHVTKSCSTVRHFRGFPIGSRPIIIEMTVQRLEWKHCGAIQQEKIYFVWGKERYTSRLKRPCAGLVQDRHDIGCGQAAAYVVGHGEGHPQGGAGAQVQPSRPQRAAVHRHRRVRRG